MKWLSGLTALLPALLIIGCAHVPEKPQTVELTSQPPPERRMYLQCNSPFFNNVLFERGSTKTNAAGIAEMQQIARWLHKWPREKIRLVGHTCDLGDENANLDLALRRATFVCSFLAYQGIESSRLLPESQGESEPAVPNDSEENRSLNRRVTIIGIPGTQYTEEELLQSGECYYTDAIH